VVVFMEFLSTVLYVIFLLQRHTFGSSSVCFAASSFLDPEGRSQKATLVVVLLVVVISSLKIPKAFVIRSGAQQNFAYTFVLLFPTDLPSQIFSWVGSYRRPIVE